jgi:hypothetical protein
MKPLRFCLLLLTPVFFVSCMDTREELRISKNGSGTLNIKTDLGKMLDMMRSFASDSDLKKDGLDRAFDTTMMMKTYLDTARDISPEKKELFKEGQVHVNLNVKEGLGKLDVQLPFHSPAQLQQLYENLNSSGGGLKGLMNGLGNKEGDAPGGPVAPGGDQAIPQIGSVYDTHISPGHYSRTVNKERYGKFSQTMKLDDLKQLSSVMGSMNYTLVVTLDKPIKKFSNPKAVLSADKKTATLETDLLQSFEHPELLELDLEY